ncbi:MAG: Isopentenyl-diphosphate Delta-isomerase [Pseudomonadota bacterium]
MTPSQVLWARLAPSEVWPADLFAPPTEVTAIRLAGFVPWGVRYTRTGLDSGPIGWLAPEMFSVLLRADLFWTTRGAPEQACLINADRLSELETLLFDYLGPEGWRYERFFVRDRSAGILLDDAAVPRPLLLERSLFRPLGILSSSVHLNLMTPQGRYWIGRRAAHKRIDPGMWDAAAAGGLPAYESAANAVGREAAEEAGLINLSRQEIRFIGRLRVCRLLTDCLHHEQVWVFRGQVAASVQPIPVDGEVETFDCVWPEEIVERYRAGQFNHEAACGSLLKPIEETEPSRTTKPKVLGA